MQFFSNKIYVNGSTKTFQDIINDVKGGMNKTASKKEAVMMKHTKHTKHTEDASCDEGETNKNKNKKKSKVKGKASDSVGLSDAQKKLPLALQKAILNKKKANDNASYLKIAGIKIVNKDEVVLELQGNVKTAKHSKKVIKNRKDTKKVQDSEGVLTDDLGVGGDLVKETVGSMGCMSSDNSKFVKIANLTDKQKTNFRKYWDGVWPKDFIDALLSVQN